MNDQNTTPPDMIQQAGELVKMLQQGQKIAVASSPFDTADRAIVLASAVLADGLLSQLAELDADNANLIARCRHYEQIEVPE